jgi:hypothetical protein
LRSPRATRGDLVVIGGTAAGLGGRVPAVPRNV